MPTTVFTHNDLLPTHDSMFRSMPDLDLILAKIVLAIARLILALASLRRKRTCVPGPALYRHGLLQA